MTTYVPCARCGKPVQKGQHSRPSPECRACHKISTQESRAKTCLVCGVAFTRSRGTFCSLSCVAVGRVRGGGTKPRTRPDEDPRVKRQHREAAAPGLTTKQRDQLRMAWRKAGRTCSYCIDGPCETVDHVVPLVRGGTNYEGNLTPCCRKCNSGKGGRTVVEWKHRKPAARFNDTRPWMVDLPPVIVRKARVGPVKPVPLEHPCEMCGGTTVRKAYCSTACQLEMNARANRERYRAKVGLSPTWDRPTAIRSRAA